MSWCAMLLVKTFLGQTKQITIKPERNKMTQKNDTYRIQSHLGYASNPNVNGPCTILVQFLLEDRSKSDLKNFTQTTTT